MASRITEAVVYLNGAQITRTEKFTLKKGVNTVTFGDLPPSMNGQSISASSDGKCKILSVTHGTAYAKTADERVSKLMKKLRGLRDDLEKEEAKLSMIAQEEDITRKNTMVSGKVFRADDMKAATAFFRERMTVLSDERFASQKRIEKLNEDIYNIEIEVGEDDDRRRRSQASIEVHCDSESESEIAISYFTQGASWTPYYDIRVKDVDSPVSIYSKATVYQNTGEDWNSVPLTLSTGNPVVGGNVPDLRPWYIDFYEPVHVPAQRMMLAKKEKEMYNVESVEEECLASPADIEAPPLPAARPVENLTSIEYILPAPYTVPSSGSGKAVDILAEEAKAEYMYKSVRKLEKDVFLVADVADWERLNLIAGEANIFFEEKYVGASFIDPRKTENGLKISLGRDKNIIVTRVKGKDFTEKSLMGSTTKVSREWTLTAKNLRKQKITIVIEDQIPVSMNKSITVDAVTLSGAEHDKEKGKLTWKLTLAPGESKALPVKYSVTYPKNKTVILE